MSSSSFSSASLVFPGGNQGGYVEPADEGPNPAVMVIAGQVITLISCMPVGVTGQYVREEIRWQAGGQVTPFDHFCALLLHPGNDFPRARWCGYPGKNCQAVAQQVETFAAIHLA